MEMYLKATEDWSKIRFQRPKLLEGEWPGRGGVVLERTSMARLPVKTGDTIQVTTASGLQRQLRVTGIVWDQTVQALAPGAQAYATMETLEYLGLGRHFNYLSYAVADNAGSEEQVRQVGRAIQDQFRLSGRLVAYSGAQDPGKHYLTDYLNAILALLAAMGALSLLLSGFLVVNTVSALLSQQIRFIGMMKAIGARTGQLMGMYLVLLLWFGAIALLVAAPLALGLGYLVTKTIAQAFNFAPSPFGIEPLPLALMATLSLGVPLLAGAFPVMAGARTTVREAISGYGLSAGYGKGLVDRFFRHVRGLSRPLSISLRNTFRRKARFGLTFATLALAGALFTGVLTTQNSMSVTVERIYHYYWADVNVDLDRFARVGTVSDILADIPGVGAVEGWTSASAEVLPPRDQATGSREAATDRIMVVAPPPDSALVVREVQAGRWLLPEDENAIVMSTTTMKSHPEWKIGSRVQLELSDKVEAEFVIVGIFPFVSGEGNKFNMVSNKYLAEVLNLRGQAAMYRIVTSPRDNATQDRVRDSVTAELKRLGYKATVSSLHTTVDAVGMIFNAIVLLMGVMALLLAVVGGLGLSGTMGMNVMERTREIGVMRSIGASNGAIRKLVIVEGLLIGLISWIGGALLGLPVGQLLCGILGTMLFGLPLHFVPSSIGPVAWLIIVIVVSTVASLLPAWSASRLTVREVLAYE
jgi:putative ABC transport system permease protein